MRSRWLAVLVLLLLPTPLMAQSLGAAAEFYRGREITVLIGYSPGGAYDVYGRLVARYLGRHLPGRPGVVAKNMPGAGSLLLARHIYQAAPRDGTVLGVVARGIAFAPLLEVAGADFDPLAFNWIGSTNAEVSVCAFWHTSGVKDWRQLKQKSYAIGGSGPTSDNEQYPRIMNNILGTRIKIVTGYPGGNDIVLAMERGELDGRCSWSWSSIRSGHPHWLADRKIDVVMQLGLARHADLPDVPLVVDLAETAEDRQVLQAMFARQTMAWPFVTSPGVPPERVALLREAFMATLADADFRAEAQAANLELSPVSGQHIESLIAKVYAISATALVRLRAILK